MKAILMTAAALGGDSTTSLAEVADLYRIGQELQSELQKKRILNQELRAKIEALESGEVQVSARGLAARCLLYLWQGSAGRGLQPGVCATGLLPGVCATGVLPGVKTMGLSKESVDWNPQLSTGLRFVFKFRFPTLEFDFEFDFRLILIFAFVFTLAFDSSSFGP